MLDLFIRFTLVSNCIVTIQVHPSVHDRRGTSTPGAEGSALQDYLQLFRDSYIYFIF